MYKASMLDELAFNDKRPATKVMLNTDFTKEIRIALKKEQIMKEHKTSFPIVVQLLEGDLHFGVGQEIHHLKKGDLIALESNVLHELRAIEDSIVRLTLVKVNTKKE